MLKKLRIAVAALFIVGITLLMVGIGQQWWGWMAKLQFLPACLALNAVVIVALVLLTLLVGRVYCSVICPLGVYQDIVNWVSSLRKGKKRRFTYKKECKTLRYGVLALFIASLIAGIQVLVALIAPYSAYGRIVTSIVNPTGWAVPVIAAITLVLVTFLAWTGGRTWCNSVCPVGTTLGLLSRFAIFRPVIDTEKCKNCHGCEKMCKSSCINSAEQTVDMSRCVACFNCIENCKFDAISYGFAYGKKKAAPAAKAETAQKAADGVDAGKRAFLTSAVIAGASVTLGAQETKLDGGLAAITAKKAPKREQRLTPPGSVSEKHFYKHCTACQLCVANCPNNVLRPSTDLGHLMQPKMDFDRGFCRPECVNCSQVCPAGAIEKITPEEKTAIHIGKAVIDYDLCISNNEGVSCGNCASHCPAGAISMVRKDADDPKSVRIPSIIEGRCIGCGKCEYLCPSRPFSAIHIEGLSTHIKD